MPRPCTTVSNDNHFGYSDESIVRIANIQARRFARFSRSRFFDHEDLFQEARLAAWQAFPRFDFSKASFRTFMEHVISNRLASKVRKAYRVAPSREAFSCACEHGTEEIHLRVDLARALAHLEPQHRLIADLLGTHTPTEIARELKVSRSTVYRGVEKIRIMLTNAQFENCKKKMDQL